MIDSNNKQLRPCIVSWALFALGVEGKAQPININTCVPKYWEKVIDTILSNPRYHNYIPNRQLAIDSYHLVSNQ